MSDALAPVPERSSSWAVSSTQKLAEFLCSESSLGYRRSGLALLAVFLLAEIIMTALGAAPIAGPWDVVALLDGGWRIVNGQVPHTDFHNPIGPLTYLLVAFGMKVASPSTSSIVYGSVLLLALLLPLAWYIAWRRLPWAIASAFVLLVGFYLISPHPPGVEILGTTYAMIYNRQSYVLIALTVLSVFVRPRDSVRSSESLEGLLVGLFLGLLLYCKITYFLMAAALVLFAFVLDRRPVRWLLTSIGAFVGVCVVFFAAFHVNLYSYLLDIATAGHSQSRALRIRLLSESVVNNGTWIYLIVFCLGLWTWVEYRSGKPHSYKLRPWLVASSIVTAALLISSGNAWQGGGVDDPLYFVAAIICLELYRRRNAEQVAKTGTSARFAYMASLVLVLPIFCGTILVQDLASGAYAVAWNVGRRPIFNPWRRLHSVNLRDFYVPPSRDFNTAYWLTRDHPQKINDGIDLLQKHLQKGDRVTTMAFANPFSFALGLPPAHDGYLWWHVNFSFDKNHFPPAKDFLGDASLVMVPRLTDRSVGCCFETADVLLELYGDYLHANFHEVDSTDTWVLYRRNGD